MGKENSKNQAHSRPGRGLNGTHVDNTVGEATRGKGHKTRKHNNNKKGMLPV